MTLLVKVLSTRNVGGLDRILRSLPTPVVAYLIHQGHVQGVVAWALGIFAALLLVTALTGSCSVHYMLGLTTCPISGKPRPD